MVKGYHPHCLENLTRHRRHVMTKESGHFYVPQADTYMQQITCKPDMHDFVGPDDESPHTIEGKYEYGQPMRGLLFHCKKCMWPAYRLVTRGVEEEIVMKLNKKYGSWLD